MYIVLHGVKGVAAHKKLNQVMANPGFGKLKLHLQSDDARYIVEVGKEGLAKDGTIKPEVNKLAHELTVYNAGILMSKYGATITKEGA